MTASEQDDMEKIIKADEQLGYRRTSNDATELLKLKARVEELEGALKPFAYAYELLAKKKKTAKENFTLHDRISLYCGSVSVSFPILEVKHFSNAASLLNRKGSEG